MTTGRFFSNGIDGTTGGYAREPLDTRQAAAEARRSRPEAKELLDLRRWSVRICENSFAPMGFDPLMLAEAGWGVIFAHDAPPQVRDALGLLLRHRQAGCSRSTGELYREYAGPAGYRRGESKRDFLSRQGVVPGVVDPRRVPYYLLLVGDPEGIPFSFQADMGLEYAVGRIHFPTPEGYARYAQSVVRSETEAPPPARPVIFFGTNHPEDPVTTAACGFVAGLARELAQDKPDLKFEQLLGEQASKARLLDLLSGRAPELLFTATHGISFRFDDPRRFPHQGALLCADWPGASAWGGRPIPHEFYLAAEDIPDRADLRDTLAFLYASHSGGFPRSEPFSSALTPLAQRLLGSPHGALAVAGYMDRLWSRSSGGDRERGQQAVFASVLLRLLEGQPIGHALEFLSQRYAELSIQLSHLVEETENSPQDDEELAVLWAANQDVHGCVILGDPAVRLPRR